MVEFLHEVWNGLVGQEHGHRREQQVNKDKDDYENILQASFVETNGH